MTQRQLGTLKHIDVRGKIREDELRSLHAGTLRSLLLRKWIYTWDTSTEVWIALTATGKEELTLFQTATASVRQHEGDLTACTMRLLRLARIRRDSYGTRKAG